MYHSETLQHIKDFIIDDMQTNDGIIRLLICSSAAEMGVNFCMVSDVIHYGPPRSIDDLLQQMGRAGRDGSQSNHLLLYSRRKCKSIDKEMLDYIYCKTCYRESLLSNYDCKVDDMTLHNCCAFCADKCHCNDVKCKQCVYHPWFIIRNSDDEDEEATRCIDDDEECELSLIISEIIDVHECLHDRERINAEDMLCSILTNCCRIFSVSDVQQFCFICCSCEQLIANKICEFFM
jgi:ATP-dependent DNA helicase RecQ